MSFILLLPRIIRHGLLWVALPILLGLTGCSTIKLAYNNSDELMYWWLDGYLDLQDGQKQFSRDTLSDLHRWHRQQQLPEYVALLKRLQTMAPNDITAAQVCAVTEDMRASVVTLLRFVEPAKAQIATQLKPDQLRAMRKKFDKTNKTWRNDWLEPDAESRLRHRTKQALNRFEDFYGRLDKPQRDVLQAWLSQSTFDPAISYAERERRQADTIQTLQRIGRDNLNPAQTQVAVRGVIERTLNSPNERYRAYIQELWNENCEGFAKLHNSTTPAQRQRLLDALRGYEADFKTLMAPK
jgi:hypothetical protein